MTNGGNQTGKPYMISVWNVTWKTVEHNNSLNDTVKYIIKQDIQPRINTLQWKGN